MYLNTQEIWYNPDAPFSSKWHPRKPVTQAVTVPTNRYKLALPLHLRNGHIMDHQKLIKDHEYVIGY